MLCAGCAGTDFSKKLVWVRGADQQGTGARVQIEAGGFGASASGLIENVAEYASIPENWAGPVPWAKDDDTAPPTGDPD